MKKIITKKYSCLIFGEGRKDKNFIKALIDLKKFKDHTLNWTFNYGNAPGGSAEMILKKCQKEIFNYSYDLIICFIDLDKLKSDYPNNKWKEEKKKLEKKYLNFKIIWQLDNLEDEFKKVLGNQYKSKHKLNNLAKQKVNKFINSSFWKRILKPIKEKEQKLIN